MNKRPLRNAAAWVPATALRFTGAIRRASKRGLESDATLGLYFHNPSAGHFCQILDWFQNRGFRFLSLDEVGSHLEARTPLPKGSAWISFDDAWRRNLNEVVPIIRERNLPVTVFVSTEEVRRGTFWFSHALRHASALPEPFRRDVLRLWRVPESTRRRVIDYLFQVKPCFDREVMSVAEITELANIPQVTIGSHSVNHALMPNCDEEELRKEIGDSKRDLEQWTGRPVRSFSYPNGDFDARTAHVLADEGYSVAFTGEGRAITATDDPFYLPRLSMMDDGSLTENICHALGIWAPVVNAIKGLRPVPRRHRTMSTELESRCI